MAPAITSRQPAISSAEISRWPAVALPAIAVLVTMSDS